MAGEITLKEFIGLVKFCNLFIGNNSGPAHIAGLMDIPTLCIMPGEILPHEWHPSVRKQ